LNADDLNPWDDFINKLRGAEAVPAHEAATLFFEGAFWVPLKVPRSPGISELRNARYDALYWDSIDGESRVFAGFLSLVESHGDPRAILGSSQCAS